jgi:hypothetical protein
MTVHPTIGMKSERNCSISQAQLPANSKLALLKTQRKQGRNTGDTQAFGASLLSRQESELYRSCYHLCPALPPLRAAFFLKSKILFNVFLLNLKMVTVIFEELAHQKL